MLLIHDYTMYETPGRVLINYSFFNHLLKTKATTTDVATPKQQRIVTTSPPCVLLLITEQPGGKDCLIAIVPEPFAVVIHGSDTYIFDLTVFSPFSKELTLTFKWLQLEN